MNGKSLKNTDFDNVPAVMNFPTRKNQNNEAVTIKQNITNAHSPFGLTEAIRTGSSLEEIKKLMTLSELDVNILDQNSHSALMIASATGPPEVVAALLRNPALDVNKTNKCRQTALSFAANAGRADIVDLLLGHPALKVNKCDEAGMTPLMLASSRGHAEVVQRLLTHPKIKVNQGTNTTNDCHEKSKNDEKTKNNNHEIKGPSALMWACGKGRLKVVEALLTHPHIDVNYIDGLGFGKSALHLACINGYSDIVETLLHHPLINVNQKDCDGYVPLLTTIAFGYDLVVLKLINHPDIDVEVRCGNGLNAFSLSTLLGHDNIYHILDLHRRQTIYKAFSGRKLHMQI